MSIKPSPTIAGKLRKLFGNNKQTIEPAIGDSVPGGGANVLTLYAGQKDNRAWCYKNPERTEEYESYDEAKSALENADAIIVDEGMLGSNKYFPTCATSDRDAVFVTVVGSDHDELRGIQAYLFYQPQPTETQ